MIFTKQERNIIIFVLFALLFGLVWVLVRKLILQQPRGSVLKKTEETLQKDEAESKEEKAGQQRTAAPDSVKVNVNSATVDEIAALPYLGRTKAQAIVDYRDNNGEFKSLKDLEKVSGIGEKLLAKIKTYIDI